MTEHSLTPADETFVAQLAAQLPEGTLRPAAPGELQEPRGFFAGKAGIVAVPSSTQEVATIVAACNAARVALVPYGGGTGLVGGQVMAEGPAPLVLSLARMSRVRAVHPSENVIEVDAGAILADVQAAAEGADRLFPLSLGSEGTARIGGLLSTNAGGVNVLRYGNARDLCLGLEAVLPDGRIWNGLRRLRKDNTGYDLRALMVGAEGTLGVITGASLRLFPRPESRAVALLVVESPAAALELLALANARIGPGLSAFELMSGQGLEFLAETRMPSRCPIDPVPAWSVLADVGLPRGQDAGGAMEALYVAASEAGLVSDGIVATSLAQVAALWRMREEIPLANRAIGAISSHDISLPLSEIPGFLEEARAEMSRRFGVRINAFGHLGDGNLHFNIFPPAGKTRGAFPVARAEVATAVYDMVAARGGSFSAEHGVGRLKVADLERYGDPVKRAAMRAIKTALDPNGIMNPGVIFPARD